MLSESNEFYDLMYGPWKDYDSECAIVARLLKAQRPNASALLDVACGTGEHARILSSAYAFRVDGLDLNPDFVRIAQGKNPEGRFVCADMVNFDLGRRYDAILCLFSGIGYVRTVENLGLTLTSFRRHLQEDGLVILEPWLAPSAWEPGGVSMRTAEKEHTKVCRMIRSLQEGRLSILEFEYLIGRPEGFERRRERHELGLFEPDEIMESFRRAGFRVEHDPGGGLIGRGLYVGEVSAWDGAREG